MKLTPEQAFLRAAPIDPNTPHPYFLARGIDTTRFPNLAQTVRVVTRYRRKETDAWGPALIFAITDNEGRIVGRQYKPLNADQSAKDGIEPKIKNGLADKIKGFAIRLGPARETIHLAEGLEDAMTVAQASGMDVTAFAMGGAGMMDGFTPPSETREIVILADGDEKGIQGAAKAVVWFAALGLTARVAQPPEDCKDFNDAISGKLGGALDKAQAMVRAAVEAAEVRFVSPFPGGEGADEKVSLGVQEENAVDQVSLLIWYGEDPPPPPPYLVSNMLPEDGVALIGGQYLLGKTFVGADLSAAVMTGGEFAGEPVVRKGAILWFAAEGEKEIEGRVRAAVENKFEGSGPQPFARQAGGVPVLTDPDALEKLKAHAQEAAKHAGEKFGLPLALIVIDTVSAAAGLTDENSASETQKVMTTLRELSRATGALVLAIDHYGKQTETGIRGSSAKSAAADAILACLGERDNEGVVSNHRLAVTKLRSGPTGRVIPFELHTTVTEFGVTCIVEWRLTEVEAAPVEKTKGWPKSLLIFKRSLLNALTDFGKKMRPFTDNLEVLVVDREKVRAEFMRAYPADSRKAKGEAFRRSERDAVERAFIVSRSIGEDLAATVFWLVRDDP